MQVRFGIEKDVYKAFLYYQKSTGIGMFLVNTYYQDRLGVKMDRNKAFFYLTIWKTYFSGDILISLQINFLFGCF